MWEKRINKILDDLDIVYATYERSIYRGTIGEKVVLLCRQSDDIAVTCSDPTVAQGFREFLAAVLVTKIAMYLLSILIELGFPPSKPALLYTDNKAAIKDITLFEFRDGSRLTIRRIRKVETPEDFAQEIEEHVTEALARAFDTAEISIRIHIGLSERCAAEAAAPL
jgi:hypothetical protein